MGLVTHLEPIECCRWATVWHLSHSVSAYCFGTFPSGCSLAMLVSSQMLWCEESKPYGEAWYAGILVYSDKHFSYMCLGTSHVSKETSTWLISHPQPFFLAEFLRHWEAETGHAHSASSTFLRLWILEHWVCGCYIVVGKGRIMSQWIGWVVIVTLPFVSLETFISIQLS